MVFNNRYPVPPNDYRDQREQWGPPARDERDAGPEGYWQSYEQDYQRGDSFNQRNEHFGRRNEPFGQRNEPFGRRNESFGERNEPPFGQRNDAFGQGGFNPRQDYREGFQPDGPGFDDYAAPYQDESRGYETDYRGYDDRGDQGVLNPGPPRRPLRPGEKPDPIKDALYEMSGNTYDLHVQSTEPKKFTGRCRLFIAPLPPSVTEDDLRTWFGQYGEVGEVFLNKSKNFAFVKMDTRETCEVAKNSLDFAKKDGVTIRVRFSSNPAAVRVSNLTNPVTNELLEAAFSAFGEVERAVVIADERGRPTGEGIVEFASKRSALIAIRKCEEECLLLTASPRPVMVEPYDYRDEDEGLPEHNIPKSKAYHAEREQGPRTAMPGSFEFEFGLKWKKLFELEAKKKEQLEFENKRCRQMMEEQLDFYMYEHEANALREKLRRMEEQGQQMQRERMRFDDGDRRRRDEDDFRPRPLAAGETLDLLPRRSLGVPPPQLDLEGPRRASLGPPQFQGQRGGQGWQPPLGPPQVPPPYQSARSNAPLGPPRY